MSCASAASAGCQLVLVVSVPPLDTSLYEPRKVVNPEALRGGLADGRGKRDVEFPGAQ